MDELAGLIEKAAHFFRRRQLLRQGRARYRGHGGKRRAGLVFLVLAQEPGGFRLMAREERGGGKEVVIAARKHRLAGALASLRYRGFEEMECLLPIGALAIGLGNRQGLA